uniref:Cytochrome P450 n=1 Tax=Octopus bimaculoides TaxID=37653 RepID=A0A0L8GPW5_OCTBM
MDVLGLTDYATTLALIAVLILTFYLFGRRNFSYFKRLGLSGPEPISHLGNLMEITKLGFTKVFKYWREIYGDVYGMYFGVVPNCVVSDPEFIQEVLVKRFSNFVNRTRFEGDEIHNFALTSAKNDHWKYLRTVLNPSFTSHKMREMNAMIQTCADNLVENIDKLAENGEVTDVKKLFSAYAIDVIAATGFGIMVNSQKDSDNLLVKKAKDILTFSLFQPIILLAC